MDLIEAQRGKGETVSCNGSAAELGGISRMRKRLSRFRELVRREKPLIHCITNHITINDCANLLLAVGARPVMAEHPKEVGAVVRSAGALAVNLGNITDVRMEAMMEAGAAARDAGIPSIIDLVGVGISELRLEFARYFTAECRPTVIKGNGSEVKAFCGVPSNAVGIDAGAEDQIFGGTLDQTAKMAAQLARQTGAAVLISGKTDLIADNASVWLAENGCPRMADVTGTGCMLNVLTAAYLAAAYANGGYDQGMEALEAALCGCCTMGLCGERAQSADGIGQFKTALLDEAERLTEREFLAAARIREVRIR